ncbi:hypothetical protein ED733_000530 [Metarhizium rileyi]|nr:hypothetical protein ED733_000530 [Metarhizium rileyi]
MTTITPANNTPAPLAALPTGVLLRSLFINAISSRPHLLRPAITFMSYLCQPNRSFVFDTNRNKLLAGIMRRAVFRHFCAGESASEVKQTLERFKSMGFRGTIVAYAKETVFDYNRNVVQDAGIETFPRDPADSCPNIERWRDGVMETIDMLGEGDQLAVKITGAGPMVTDALAARGPLPKQM